MTQPPAPRAAARIAGGASPDGGPVAVVGGKTLRELPADLYIPPDALRVFLDAFEGPLDLLLYLIRRQNLDMLDIKVAEITEQYLHYIDLMKTLELDLAGEYLLMAATLAEIKSRLLLPQPDSEESEEDPRAALVRRLEEYERFKLAAERIDDLPRLERDLHAAGAAKPDVVKRRAHPDVDMRELVHAFAEVMRRAALHQNFSVSLEGLSVRERMSEVLARVGKSGGFVPFLSLFEVTEGRAGVVVTFLALMELVRESLLELAQNQPFAPIYVRTAGASRHAKPPRDG